MSLAPTVLVVEAVAVPTVSVIIGDDLVATLCILLSVVVHVVVAVQVIVAVVVVVVVDTVVLILVWNALAKTVRGLNGSVVQ